MAGSVGFDPRFDADVGRQLLKYARLVSARGYVHNTLGNIDAVISQRGGNREHVPLRRVDHLSEAG